MSDRKNKKKKDSVYLRLLIEDGITMSVRENRAFPERLVRTLIALLGVGGTILVVQGFFDFPVNPLSPLLFAIGLMLGLRLIRQFSPKTGFICILGAFAVIPVALLCFREQAVAGAAGIYDVMRRTIFPHQEFAETENSAGRYTEADCVRFVFDLLILALVALMEYSDVLLAHSHSSKSGFWIRLLVTFPFLECGLYFGLETSSAAVFMLVAFWIGTLTLTKKRLSGHSFEVRLTEPATNRSGKRSKSDRHRFCSQEPAALLLLLAMAVLAGAALFTTKNFIRSEKLNEKRKQILEAYNNFSIEEFFDWLRELPGGSGSDQVTDEIDLLRSDNPKFNGATVLDVTVGGAATPDDYYLRGIVRSEYTGRGWGVATGAYQRQQSLLRKLTEENRMPQTIFHSDHVDELRTENGKFPVVRCSITARQREAVNYLPRQSVFEAGTRYRYDTEIEFNDRQNYSFWLMNNARANWSEISEATAPSSSRTVREYEKFVDDLYLAVPDTDAMRQIRADFAPEMPNSNLLLEDKLLIIRDYIWERSEYSVSPPMMPADSDFAAHFLLESHEGYCAHYASAAVLLCRMCGIPARYCQGYVMTTSNFAAAKNAGDYRIAIPDNQAHAWAEIYVKGYGWIPYEFTESVQQMWHRPVEATQTAPVTTTATTSTAFNTAATTATTARPVVTAVTSRPAVTGTGETGTSQGTISTARRSVRVVLSTLAVCALLALIVLAYLTYHRYVLNKRQQAMQDGNPIRAAEASYDFLLQLLEMQGILQGGRTHEAFAEEAEKQCKLLPKGKITQAVTMQQQAVFSRDGASAEEAAVIRTVALALAKAYYDNAKPLKKLWLRWGRHLM